MGRWKAAHSLKNLQWVVLTQQCPSIALKKRKRSQAQRRGLRYQKVVGRWFRRQAIEGDLYLDQWIEFADEDGRGYAQPDIFIVGSHTILLIECKLTQNSGAGDQLEYYATLLQYIYPRHQILKLQVCRNLMVLPKLEVTNPFDLLANRQGGIWTWHFIGE